MYRVTEQVPTYQPQFAVALAPRVYTTEPPVPQKFASSIFRSTESRMDAESRIRDRYPLEAAARDAADAEQLRNDAARRTDAVAQAKRIMAQALDERARETRDRVREQRVSSAEAIEEGRQQQQQFLEMAMRRARASEALSRQALLHKADTLQSLGRADEALVIRQSVFRADQAGDTVQ